MLYAFVVKLLASPCTHYLVKLSNHTATVSVLCIYISFTAGYNSAKFIQMVKT